MTEREPLINADGKEWEAEPLINANVFKLGRESGWKKLEEVGRERLGMPSLG